MQVYRDYPLKAMGMLLFAKTLGSMICFGIARKVISDSRKQLILANPTISKVNRVLSKSPKYYGTLCRLATMPTVVKNYGLALLEIRFGDYMVRAGNSKRRQATPRSTNLILCPCPGCQVCCLLGSAVGVPMQALIGMHLGAVTLGISSPNEAKALPPLWTALAALVSHSQSQPELRLYLFVTTHTIVARVDGLDAADARGGVGFAG